MREQSDTELVKQFQRGNSLAFATFVERHRDRLYRLACVWATDPALAEDAVQEAFVRSYTGLAKFRAAPSTWLIRVCRNVCLELNRQGRREERAEPEVFERQEAPSLPDTVLPCGLDQALRSLPPRQRDVVVLRLLEDRSVRDTAKILQCREGTVKAHLAKALANLRTRIEGIEEYDL